MTEDEREAQIREQDSSDLGNNTHRIRIYEDRHFLLRRLDEARAEIARLRALGWFDVAALFTAIAHGNDMHRQWLLSALRAYRDGEPIPKPQSAPPGAGAMEIATEIVRPWVVLLGLDDEQIGMLTGEIARAIEFAAAAERAQCEAGIRQTRDECETIVAAVRAEEREIRNGRRRRRARADSE